MEGPLQYLRRLLEQLGWLEALGDRGPWIAERLVGMRELPASLDCNGKVSMLEECVRRAAVSAAGDVGVRLHRH